jgi:hypothetical protein
MDRLFFYSSAFERNGHRVLISGSQSWGSFTSELFGNEKDRGEFDLITFEVKFSDMLKDTTFSVREAEEDDESLTSVYFGRPLRQIIVSVCTKRSDNDILVDELCDIFDHSFQSDDEAVLCSKPKWVVSKIHEDGDIMVIEGYYLWQLSEYYKPKEISGEGKCYRGEMGVTNREKIQESG